MFIMSKSTQYRIVSGAQLPNYMRRNIAIFGVVSKPFPAGSTSFTMNTTDNLLLIVKLNKPLESEISGYVEIRGVCEATSEGKVIKADEYFTFNNQQFDARNHNLMCKFINSIPNVYSNKGNNS